MIYEALTLLAGDNDNTDVDVWNMLKCCLSSNLILDSVRRRCDYFQCCLVYEQQRKVFPSENVTT